MNRVSGEAFDTLFLPPPEDNDGRPDGCLPWLAIFCLTALCGLGVVRLIEGVSRTFRF